MNTTTMPASAPDATAASEMPHSHSPARQYHAQVLMYDGRRYCVLTDEGCFWVVAAAGCLLQPAVADTVLVSIVGAGGYVLNVLERAQPDHDAVVALPGTLRLQAEKVEITARKGLNIDAGTCLDFKAGTARMHYQTLDMKGSSLHTRWTHRTDVAEQRIDIASYSEIHRGRSIRRISGHEEVTTASYRQTVTRDWTLSAGTASLVGQYRVAIDGNSVQIG